jgi:hypothetical protein
MLEIEKAPRTGESMKPRDEERIQNHGERFRDEPVAGIPYGGTP